MVQKTAAVKELDCEYKSPGNRLVVLYGREGCRKELYIRDFLKGKEFFYYRAGELSDAEQKKRFADKIDRQYHLDEEEADYEIYFERLHSKDGSKLVFVIDEFEYLIKKNADFLENLFRLRQNKSSKNEIMILLCSSSLVFVEHKMASVLGRMYSLIDTVYKIKELNFLNVVRMFPESTVSECIEIFGILGGVPSYLKYWNSEETVKENICRMILSADGILFSEAERYLRKELRELSVYNTILTVIAAGCQKLNDLYKYTGYSRAKISVYLKNLMEFDVIEKVISFETGGRENTQKGVYQIKDTLIHFWFKFVFPHLSDLYLYTPEDFYEMYIEKELQEYLNPCFVRVCMEYLNLMNQAGKLPFEIHKIGTWIGKRGNIDIIAQNDVRENIVGICSWSEEQMAYVKYEQLEERMKEAHIGAKHYFFFSGKSFAPALMKRAREDKRITLVDMTEL